MFIPQSASLEARSEKMQGGNRMEGDGGGGRQGKVGWGRRGGGEVGGG